MGAHRAGVESSPGGRGLPCAVMARESQAERRKRALRIARRLARAYPDAACALRFRSPFELLVATILSAQCTDKVVNDVTPELFRCFPTPRAAQNYRSIQAQNLRKNTKITFILAILNGKKRIKSI